VFKLIRRIKSTPVLQDEMPCALSKCDSTLHLPCLRTQLIMLKVAKTLMSFTVFKLASNQCEAKHIGEGNATLQGYKFLMKHNFRSILKWVPCELHKSFLVMFVRPEITCLSFIIRKLINYMLKFFLISVLSDRYIITGFVVDSCTFNFSVA
jgi:hypothetical protein